MDHDSATAKIAIIGLGPRGLGALEALATLSRHADTPLRVDVFDPFPAKGAGPNFDPAESPTCLLNIPFRDIAIGAPAFSRCGNFADWLDRQVDPDSFPPRADLGRYLEARLADLTGLGLLAVTFRHAPVDRVTQVAGGWQLEAGGAAHGPYAEVLLTVGQPAVTPDPQLAAWQDHAGQTGAILTDAYPAHRLTAMAADWTGKTVAIRGMALSAFDILRVLTTGQGGRFQQGRYLASGREPALILPFSLDGRPPYPKPATAALDAGFDPLQAETDAFSAAMATAVNATPDVAEQVITAALVPVIRRLLQAHDAKKDEDAIQTWLKAEWSSPGTQETGTPPEILSQGIALAQGHLPPSIGYAVGQVWRKWQNALRASYNSAALAPQTAKTILGFDEGLKRYSYGPPLASSMELRALLDCGLVDLELCADPGINLTQTGWTLSAGTRSALADVMVDGVMDPPDVSRIRAAPIKGLVEAGRIVPLGQDLAAHIAPDGQLWDDKGRLQPGLCLLGRLASGSVIAADSLHDCFGRAADRWAEGVVRRLGGMGAQRASDPAHPLDED
ncbi:MAG: FAD/NAD(P)-binding protein [Paracoccaceae bacterium]|nr:FAD/NAD(P)-binding protein [Paracoccaceae bacterium]